jgi:hypothetical protein
MGRTCADRSVARRRPRRKAEGIEGNGRLDAPAGLHPAAQLDAFGANQFELASTSAGLQGWFAVPDSPFPIPGSHPAVSAASARVAVPTGRPRRGVGARVVSAALSASAVAASSASRRMAG